MVFHKSHIYCLFFLKVSERSTSPRWDEGFHFLTSDPRSEILTVKVRVIIYIYLDHEDAK